MDHYFKGITRATIICTILGFLISGSLIGFNIRTEPVLPKAQIILSEDSLQLDTLQFFHRTSLAYDSNRVASVVENNTEIGASHFFFHFNPEFLVWVVLVTIMMSISLGISPLLLDRLYYLQSWFKVQKSTLWGIVAVGAGFGLVFLLLLVKNPYLYTYTDWIGYLEILVEHTWVLQVVIAVPTITGLIALVGMIFISKSIDQLKPDKAHTFKEQFTLLNNSLRFFLLVSTTLITFAVFTSGALRKAIMQEVVAKGIDMIPIEFVYLYGLQFSIVLAIFYLPIYYQLRNRAQKYLSSVDDDEAHPGISAFMNESISDSLKIALSILAPLISGFLPDMIHF